MVIETERLILRPFKESDAENLFEYLNEPAVNCFAGMKIHSLEEARKEALRRAEDTEYYFAITVKDSGKVIGEIDASPEAAAPGEDAVRDTFSPCWMLNKEYQGKGYAYERHMLSLTTFFMKKTQDVFSHIRRTITFRVNTCVKSWACGVRACLWSSCRL